MYVAYYFPFISSSHALKPVLLLVDFQGLPMSLMHGANASYTNSHELFVVKYDAACATGSI